MKSSSKIEREIKKRLTQYEQYPVMYDYQPRLCEISSPPPMWKLFYKQKDAISYAKTVRNNRAFVISFEYTKPGPRNFIVASLEEFWSYYSQMPASKRHFYEVILDGDLCHLYFDVEFDKTINLSKSGEDMVQLWISYTSLCLSKEFNILTSRENVIELTSTTPTKFSQHLIWHLPATAFKNNIEVGKFVKKMCKDLLSYLQLKSENFVESQKHWLHGIKFKDELDLLLVDTSDSKKDLFVDQGVYSRNRNFRLFKSSKKGKLAELALFLHCQFIFEPTDIFSTCCSYHKSYKDICKRTKTTLCDNKEKLIFFASFITNTFNHDDLKILEMPVDECASSSLSILTVPRVTSHSHTEKLNDIPARLSLDDDDAHIFNDQNIPFNELYDFIGTVVKQFNGNAKIRSSTYFPKTNVISYEITGTRYCGNIKREHKSNGIIFVVNLSAMYCYQKCHDPVCSASNYKSSHIPLPQPIIAKLSSVPDMSDAELLTAVATLENSNVK